MRPHYALIPAAVLAVSAALTGCAGMVTAVQGAAAPTVTGQIPAYDRDAFGGWADLDEDRCNGREEILARDSGAGDCPPKAPLGLTIADPYTGEQVTDRAEIDIDHVVSLRDAWDSGAWAWTDGQRIAFANSAASLVPGCPNCSELVASSDDVNRDKSDEDVAEWRGDRASWCWHATTYRAVKQHWRLVITTTQQAALGEMARTCGGTP